MGICFLDPKNRAARDICRILYNHRRGVDLCKHLWVFTECWSSIRGFYNEDDQESVGLLFVLLDKAAEEGMNRIVEVIIDGITQTFQHCLGITTGNSIDVYIYDPHEGCYDFTLTDENVEEFLSDVVKWLPDMTVQVAKNKLSTEELKWLSKNGLGVVQS